MDLEQEDPGIPSLDIETRTRAASPVSTTPWTRHLIETTISDRSRDPRHPIPWWYRDSCYLADKSVGADQILAMAKGEQTSLVSLAEWFGTSAHSSEFEPYNGYPIDTEVVLAALDVPDPWMLDERFPLTRDELDEAQRQHQAGAALVRPDVWWIHDDIVFAPRNYTREMVELQIWDQDRRRDARFERLRKIRAREEDFGTARREAIPGEVRAFVWRRDEGRCVSCGADEDLQFDHVIPVVKGGGNGIGNVQILCGDCNRMKSDSIV
jgi:hypothetical protein